MKIYRKRALPTGIFSLLFVLVYSLNSQGATATGTQATSTASEPGSVEISIIGDVISADVSGATLKAVLGRLQEDYDIAYNIDEGVSNRKVFAKFEEKPLEEGFRKILSPLSLIMVYDENKRIKKLFVIDVPLGESVASGPGESLEGDVKPLPELSPSKPLPEFVAGTVPLPEFTPHEVPGGPFTHDSTSVKPLPKFVPGTEPLPKFVPGLKPLPES